MGNYCDQVDCDKVNVHDGNGSKWENRRRAAALKLTGGRSVTVGNDVYLADDDLDDFGTLAHELGHVYQFQVQYKSDYGLYLNNALGNQASDALYNATRGMIGRDEYAVGTLLSNKPFSKYRMNQQAEIVRLGVTGVVPWACSLSPIRR